MQTKTPFFWRILAGYALVSGIAVLLLGLILYRLVGQHELDEVEQDLQAQAQLASLMLADPLAGGQEALLRRRVEAFSLATGSRLTVIAPGGRVLADSHEDPAAMDNHLQRPEVLQAIAAGSGRARRFSNTLQEEFSYYALPLDGDAGHLGYVRTAMSLAELRAERLELQSRVLAWSLAGYLAALLAGALLVGRMARPVGRMTALAQQVARGDFDRRLPVDNRAGLGRLAQAINELARTSAQRVGEITSDRNRLAAIFAGMVEGVIDVNQQQQIIHINDAAATMLGINPKSCLNKPIWQEVRVQEINRALEEAISSRDVVKTQMRLSRQDNDLVVDIYAASLNNAQGDPIGAVIVLHDITELEKLERVRTDFVANASHELKTPITAIRGLAETLLGDEDMDRDILQRFVGRIHQQSIRLSRLVTDLMAISRLESAQDRPSFAPINLSELVKRSVQAAEPLREEKKQSLLLRLPEERVMVLGDNQNLSQLVDNLVDNAIKYTPEGGRIEVRLREGAGHAILSVDDNGIGISPQYQQRVFERFYRVDKARSQSLGGTGLGLSIVKNIAEKHGGKVSLQSQMGRGSTFTVTLPLRASGSAVSARIEAGGSGP